MKRWGGSGRAFLLYGLATLPFGILVHLLSEASAVGFEHLSFAFVLGHLYLGALGFIGFVGAKQLLAPYRDGKRLRAAALRRDLPFGARGWRFYALAYAWQLGFFGLTIAAEGDPLSHGDWILGSVVALALAAAGSSALGYLAECIERIFSGWYMRRERRRLARLSRAPHIAFNRVQMLHTGYAAVIGNRPPPKASFA
jgi:hypothetical protein